jgi:X-X-X-Leu-X-X-Gly heptad repeat protein
MVRNLLLCVLLVFSCPLWAGTVTADGYDMMNGQSGSWRYLDSTYLPCPTAACTSNLGTLTGGAGQLIDGVAPAFSWGDSGQPGGTFVPWVGWYSIDPGITFHFSGTPTITRVGLYLDNTPGWGDVRLPSQVDIAGQDFNITADANFGPRWMYFDLAPVTADTLAITLYRDSGRWTMIGEVAFEGPDGGTVPEPAGLLLAAPALALFAIGRRRRNRA